MIRNSYLIRMFEHNNWANQQIIQVCSRLSDKQLDTSPPSFTKGSIRQTLMHLVRSQNGYLSLLTKPVEERSDSTLTFEELQASAQNSGMGLLALAKGDQKPIDDSQIETTDGYRVAPWVVMVQVIDHASEHREQIKSMLTAQGIKPPAIDGWTYGEVTGELVKLPE